mmetsp:Transcript_32768/g.69808  ORF Transcript_32768/g.69808 Transcript_32768/m.69808 type:complete len:232 (+) Transcript_32768:714-1409(+)
MFRFVSGFLNQSIHLSRQQVGHRLLDLGVLRIKYAPVLPRLLRQTHVPHREAPYAPQRNALEPKLLTLYLQQAHVLPPALPLGQRRGHAAPRLGDAERPHQALRGVDEALVFVSPYHEVHPLRYHGLVDAVLGAAAEVAVLVQGEDVEPAGLAVPAVRVGIVGLGLIGSEELDLLALPHSVEALVPHAPHPVEGHLGIVLLDQYWGDPDVVHLVLAAEVVDKVGHREEVDG